MLWELKASWEEGWVRRLPGAQCLGLRVPIRGVRVQILIGELRSNMSLGCSKIRLFLITIKWLQIVPWAPRSHTHVIWVSPALTPTYSHHLCLFHTEFRYCVPCDMLSSLLCVMDPHQPHSPAWQRGSRGVWVPLHVTHDGWRRMVLEGP